MTDEIRDALDPIADALEAVSIDYRVGGSVAVASFASCGSSADPLIGPAA